VVGWLKFEREGQTRNKTTTWGR